MGKSEQDFLKNFNQPDETRQFQSHGHLDLVRFGDGFEIGRGIFEPGWKWSNDVRPLAQTESCQADHHGYCVSGSMKVRMDSGEEFTVKPGDVVDIPPGHDAWVLGDEPCVLLDVTGYTAYAKLKRAAA